jgi:osmotically-inducible protein OsmY
MPRPCILLLLVLIAALPACAPFQAMRECGWHGCPGDAALATAVRQALDQHVELRAPNQVYVQVLNRVVYLTGQVSTDLQRQIAVAVARQVHGVHQVVNSISGPYEGR